jgi:hypothetical protein
VPGHKLSVYVADDDNGDMAKVVPLGCNSVGQAEGVDVGFVMAQQVGAQLVGK